MDIQLATLADGEELAWLGREMQAESIIGFPDIDPPAIAAYLLLVSAHPERMFMAIARDEGAPVGLISGVIGAYPFSDELRACCETLFVLPEFRGRYAGVRLLRSFDAWATACSARSIYLGISTGISPDRTARLLARIGYAALGQTFRKEIGTCVAV
jgi:GNAT superfamily N-acetyltransferase